MSAAIDERIVAAKFDASDFEKGVDKTIKKLDELKKSIDLKDTSKSVDNLSEKVKTSTDSMSSSLEKLTNRLTTFTGMIKQNILSGLAEQVSGVFLRMEQSIVSFIRTLGSQQISVGMAKYEQMLTSVRTMIAAGESQGRAYEAIDALREYSDQTSYSLSQMTDALSKFRAAGVDLDTATKSVQGISNACATAGVNAFDAQRAFYNLSQAFSSGGLKYTDYRSLELLNMTTEKFKQNMLDAAVEAGTLKKINDDVYKTISKQGEKITAGKKVTIKNIRDALKYGFMTNAAMNELFGGKYYFSEKEWSKYKKKYTDKNGNVDRERAIAEAKKDFNEYAVDAYLAAREARNFTDVMNTLKDVISTGWSTTFENLFGKLEQATKFFTNLAEGPLAEAIYKISDYRNTILGYWNTIDAAGDQAGTKMLQNTIYNITDALGILIKTFQQLLPGFDELDNKEDEEQKVLKSIGEKMQRLSADIMITTLRIKKAMETFNKWMNSPIIENGPTRIEIIRKTIANLMTVFSIAGKVVGIVFNMVTKAIINAEPLINSIITAFEKLTEPLAKLNENDKPFSDLEHSANNLLTVLKPITDGLSKVVEFLGEVGAFIINLSLDTVTSELEFFSEVVRFFIDIFTDGKSSQSLEKGKTALDEIRESFEGIKEVCTSGLNAVKEFMSSLISDLRTLFGLTDEKSGEIQNGGIFANLTNFFKNNEFIKSAKEWINTAIVDVGNFIKDIPNKLKQFAVNVYDAIWHALFVGEEKEIDEKNGQFTGKTNKILTPFGIWVDNAIKDIKDFFVKLPDRIIEGVGKVGDWINTIFDYWFGDKVAEDAEKNTKPDEKDNAAVSRFEEFYNTIKDQIIAWFDDLPNKIQKGFSSIGNFFVKLYRTIDEFILGKKAYKKVRVESKDGKVKFLTVSHRIKSGFSKWLDNLIKDIKKFIKNIPTYIKAGIRGAGDFVSMIVNSIFGNNEDTNSDATSQKIENQIKKPFLGIDWNSILATIQDIGRTLINEVARIFTGTDDVEYNAEFFSNKIAEGIEWIRKKAEGAFKAVEEFIPTIPTRIANFFKGEGKDANEQEKGPVGKAISDFANSIKSFILNLPETITSAFIAAINGVGVLWDALYNAIIGESNQASTKISKYAEDQLGYPKSYAHVNGEQKSAWKKFVEKLGELISTAFKELPEWVAKGIDMAVIGIDSLLSSLTEKLKATNIQEEAEKITKEATEGTGKAAAKGAEEASKDAESNESGLWKAIKHLGLSIYTLITETLPTFISEAWTYLKDNATSVWEGVERIFSGKPATNFEADIIKLGKRIKWALTVNLPVTITKAWNRLSLIIQHLFGVNTAHADVSTEKMLEERFALRGVGRAIKESDKEATEEVKQEGSVWSFVETFKTSLLDALEAIGPTLLNGLSKALDWLTRISEFIVDLLTGKTSISKEIEKKYGKQKPELLASLTRIGESLKDFFLKAVPRFIGAAIGAIISKSADWFTELFNGLNESMSKSADDQNSGGGAPSKVFDDTVEAMTGLEGNKNKPLDNILKILGGFVDGLKDLGNNADVQAIAIIITIGFILSKLKELFSISRELEAGGDFMKWTAITLAVVAIASIMHSLIDLVKTGTPKQIKDAEDIIDKIGNALEKVVWVVGLLSAGKLIDLIGKFAGSSDKLSLKIKNSEVNLNESVINLPGKQKVTFLEAASNMMQGLMTKLGFAGGTAISAKLLTWTIDDSIKSLTNTFNDLISGIDTAMELFDPLINKLTSIGQKINDAIDAIDGIRKLFLHLFDAFDSIYTDSTGRGMYETNIDDQAASTIITSTGKKILAGDTENAQLLAYMAEFNDRLDFYINAVTFLEKVADAAEKIGNVTNISSGLTQMLEFMSSDGPTSFGALLNKAMNALYYAYEESDLYTNRHVISRADSKAVLVTMNSSFELLSNVLSIFANGLGGMNGENVGHLVSALDMIKKVGEVYKDGGNGLKTLGANLKMFSNYLKSFYSNISELIGFDDEKIVLTNRRIDSIIKLVGGMSESAEELDRFGSGFKFLGTLGDYLPDLGNDFGAFVEQLNEAIPDGITDDRLNVISGITSSISALLSAFGDLGYLSRYNGFDGTTYQKLLDDMYENLKLLIDNPKSNKFGGLAAELYRVINDPLTGEEAYAHYTEAGRTIAGALYSGIQAAFDDPSAGYQITPVFKLDESKIQNKDYFINGRLGTINTSNSYSVVGLNQQTDEKLSAIQSTLESINAKVESLGNNAVHVGDIAGAFAGMKVVTNTGALVGSLTPAIDRAIGERIWLIQRNNAVAG